MWGKFCLAFAIAVIGGTILSVDAQSTVDDHDSASCESSAFEEAVKSIKEGFQDVKTLLGSHQQQNNASSISKKDLEDLKAACASNQQQSPMAELPSSKQALASHLLCEYIKSYLRPDIGGWMIGLVSK